MSRYFRLRAKGGSNGRPFKCGSKFELRYYLWGLMWVARIARPCDLYDTSLAARTFGDFNRDLANLRVSEATIVANFIIPGGVL